MGEIRKVQRKRPPEPVDLPAGMEHGTLRGYRSGDCGCDACFEAMSTDQILRQQRLAAGRARLRPAPDAPPGTTIDAIAWVLDNPDPDWVDRARCRNSARLNEVFHQVDVLISPTGLKPKLSAAGAKVPAGYVEFCETCPVNVDCIADALRSEPAGYRQGYWGSTPAQRNRVAAALRRLAQGRAS